MFRRGSIRWRPLAIAALALVVGGYLWWKQEPPRAPVPGPATPGMVEIAGRLEDAEGTPLPGRSLQFHLENDPKYTSVWCRTQQKGEFLGRCPPGQYRVTLPAQPDSGIPKRYGVRAETPWKVTVGVNGEKGIRLRVE